MESIVTESLGWIGAVAFSLCAVPQSWQSYKQGHSRGINPFFLILWILGEITTLLYILLTTKQLPLIFNYSLNLVCLSVIFFYKYRERDSIDD